VIYVLVQDGVVVQADRTGGEPPAGFIAAPDYVCPGYAYDSQTHEFYLPGPPLAELKSRKLSALAARRWRAETGGISVNGSPVATDERSQAKFVGACLAATLDANYSVQWKLADGGFTTLDHDQIIAIAQAVRAHVQACFDHEATFAGAVQAAPDEQALAAIDVEAGWPA
jgi:hypothetical protein